MAVAQALSAFDFHPGDVLVTTRNDYTSNQLMYLSLARRLGVEVLRADDLPEGGVDPDSVRRLAVAPALPAGLADLGPTNSGLVQAAEEVGEICEAAGVPYLVDACQAVGQLPIDVGRLRCDYLAATARKFLRGPRGIGFLYVSDRALARGRLPALRGHAGRRPARRGPLQARGGRRRFENWEFPYALVLGLGAAARYALEAGIEETGAGRWRSRPRSGSGRAPCRASGLRTGGLRLCAIATVRCPRRCRGPGAPAARRPGSTSTSRLFGAGPNNAPEAGAGRILRISPHYYNTPEEIGTGPGRPRRPPAQRGLMDRPGVADARAAGRGRAGGGGPPLGRGPARGMETMPGQALLTGRMLTEGTRQPRLAADRRRGRGQGDDPLQLRHLRVPRRGRRRPGAATGSWRWSGRRS